MKTSLFCLFLAGSALAAASLQMARADDATTPDQTAGASNGASGTTPTAEQMQRFERFKAALEALNLTDDQKAKIKQIRATVTDRKERRHEIIAILTPDQKAKLWQMIKEHREENQGGTGATTAPGGT
jgi:Spy/CpxP family protein refolding chaperone